jgi:hypothetical protein
MGLPLAVDTDIKASWTVEYFGRILMNKLVHVGATLLALTVFACGGDDETEPDPSGGNDGTVNEAVVEQVATTAFDAAQTAVGGDGQAAAFAMLGVGTSAIAIVTPGTAGSSPMGQAQQALAQEGCECDTNTCNFTGCDTGSGITLTGSISWTDNSLDCDYSIGGSNGAQTFNYAILCDLDYTDTSLDGSLSTSGDITAGGQATSFNTSLMFNMVTFDASGPTGGSIDVSASFGTGGQSYSADASVSFP